MNALQKCRRENGNTRVVLYIYSTVLLTSIQELPLALPWITDYKNKSGELLPMRKALRFCVYDRFIYDSAKNQRRYLAGRSLLRGLFCAEKTAYIG